MSTKPMIGHVVKPRVYIGVFIALICLTVTTWGVAQIDLGPFNALVALGIATIKSLFVILFFMHVKYSPKMTKVTLISGFFFLLILLTLTMTDYISRPWVGPGTGNRTLQPPQTP